MAAEIYRAYKLAAMHRARLNSAYEDYRGVAGDENALIWLGLKLQNARASLQAADAEYLGELKGEVGPTCEESSTQ